MKVGTKFCVAHHHPNNRSGLVNVVLGQRPARGKMAGPALSARSDNEKERGAVGRHRAAPAEQQRAFGTAADDDDGGIFAAPAPEVDNGDVAQWQRVGTSPEGCGFDSLRTTAPSFCRLAAPSPSISLWAARKQGEHEKVNAGRSPRPRARRVCC